MYEVSYLQNQRHQKSEGREHIQLMVTLHDWHQDAVGDRKLLKLRTPPHQYQYHFFARRYFQHTPVKSSGIQSCVFQLIPNPCNKIFYGASQWLLKLLTSAEVLKVQSSLETLPLNHFWRTDTHWTPAFV